MSPNSNYEQTVAKEVEEKLHRPMTRQAEPWKFKINWAHTIIVVYKNIAALYGLYLLCFKASWSTVVFTTVLFYISSVSVMAGAHRLWSHRSYKATRPLQLFLALGYCLASPRTIFYWALLHRVHHRYSDTDADPHNSSRGFFFSHIGWVCVEPHPEVRKRWREVDMKDITANPIVMFQKRHTNWLHPLIGFILPTIVPMYFWNESFNIAYHATIFRFSLGLHGMFSINSFAHIFGSRPYDRSLAPTQNIITTILSIGEGFHNYHHAFPYDYKAGELGSFFNFSTSFIDFCAKFGLAYDLREASKEVLEGRVKRTGDGSTDKYGVGFVGDLMSMGKCVD